MALWGSKKRRKYPPRRAVTPESARAHSEAVKHGIALERLRSLKDNPEVGKELVRATYGIHAPSAASVEIKKAISKRIADRAQKIVDSDPALREGPGRRQIEERMRDQGLTP